jgi:hypothetical protein
MSNPEVPPSAILFLANPNPKPPNLKLTRLIGYEASLEGAVGSCPRTP